MLQFMNENLKPKPNYMELHVENEPKIETLNQNNPKFRITWNENEIKPKTKSKT